jgi:hypothetical protein
MRNELNEVSEADLDGVKLDSRTNGKWKGERLEAFACAACDAVFIGVPDCHLFLVNPNAPEESAPYNLPRKSKCPKCESVIHNPSDGSGSRRVSREEMTEWNWILV